MRPLNWPRRVDIESPHWHDTKESDGSGIINMNLLNKNYFTWGALQSVKPQKSTSVFFYIWKMRPLHWPRRVDIVGPHWHDTKDSDGSTNFNKYLLKKKLFYLRRVKELKPPKSTYVFFYIWKMRPLHWPRRVDIVGQHWHDTKDSDGSTNFNKNLLKKNYFAWGAL